MDAKQQPGASTWRPLLCFTAGVFCATLLATVLFVFIAPGRAPPAPRCGEQAPHFDKETTWRGVERLNIEEHAVTVLRTDNAQRCYISPYNPAGERRAYALVPEALSDDAVEAAAGRDARLFCEDSETYLLRDVQAGESHRVKRDEEAAAAPTGGKPPPRESGLDKEYEERVPRCMDIVLDCGSGAGEVQKCYTWLNGVILMAQQCESETVFKIYMTKPPGRILKIFQQQWKVCLARRKEGKRC